MISIAIKERIAIELFFANYEHDPNDRELHILDDQLSNDDWGMLEKINNTLTLFKQTSMSLESSFATLYHTIPSMDMILDHLEERRNDTSDAIMMPMYQQAWEKMIKYYKLLDDSPAYVASVILHPGIKQEYIEKHWKKEWADQSKVSTLYDC